MILVSPPFPPRQSRSQSTAAFVAIVLMIPLGVNFITPTAQAIGEEPTEPPIEEPPAEGTPTEEPPPEEPPAGEPPAGEPPAEEPPAEEPPAEDPPPEEPPAEEPPANETPVETPPMGMTINDISSLRALGATPRYASLWAGMWLAQSGWSGFDESLRAAKNNNTTPVVFWYYWGDSISPNCVKYGCDGRSLNQWMSMTDTLANHLRAELGEREVLIVLENEFNKRDIPGAYAPTFDMHLDTVAKKLKVVPGARIVLGFGGWDEGRWDRFPKAAAQSDLIGFQTMRGSTRDNETNYRAAAERVAQLADHVFLMFNKPAFLYDLALSSYPTPEWDTIQKETLDAVFANVHASNTTNLQGVLYRSLNDAPNIDPKNHYGYAERHWGLKRDNGTADKPALATWKSASLTAWPPSPAHEPRELNISFYSVKVDEWWVQTSVVANHVLVKVEARVNGGSWMDIPRQSWGGYAKSIHILNGQYVEFMGTSTDGSTAMSQAYGRGGVVVTPGAPPPPTTFAASFAEVKLQEWWVQVSVGGNKPIAKVDAQIDSGPWTELPKQSWGGYAKSIHLFGGQRVVFRAAATDGSTVTSDAYTFGSPPPPPPPPGSGLTAVFSAVKIYEWWVQTSLSADKPIAEVEARVNGGSWVLLDKPSWGYAKSIHVLNGQHVEFRATATDGSSAISSKYFR